MVDLVKRTRPYNDDKLESLQPNPILSDSAAAKFNVAAMRKLQRALEADPEVDLANALPLMYSSRLAARKTNKEESVPTKEPESIQQDGIMPIKLPESPACVVHRLSDTVNTILNIHHDETNSMHSSELTKALAGVLKKSEILWQSECSPNRYIAKCSPEVVIKSFARTSDYTEYTSMQFLEVRKPHLPVPRPHGLITCGESSFLFMSLIPGTTLAKVWPQLEDSQKIDLSNDLNSIFLDLRQLKCPTGTPLGGVAGEGCKDARRHIRRSKAPLYTGDDFYHFQYGEARCASDLYLGFLRKLTSPFQAHDCVFTHGDVRTENIMVHLEDGKYRVTGIIDWEMSGFYPEDHECTKVTNTLATNETDDWYLHLPSCIAPAEFPLKWLSDTVWDNFVV
ncbi:hypothetical protein MMC24_005893 [Lignoscripta atroalba]|nr:hypothetical protein [Lignoscripta atroalba]